MQKNTKLFENFQLMDRILINCKGVPHVIDSIECFLFYFNFREGLIYGELMSFHVLIYVVQWTPLVESPSTIPKLHHTTHL